MKLKRGERLPSWYRWSDGRALSINELQKLSYVRKHSRRQGETLRDWFERARAQIEKYEAEQKEIS